jgi:hypothetical protein
MRKLSLCGGDNPQDLLGQCIEAIYEATHGEADHDFGSLTDEIRKVLKQTGEVTYERSQQAFLLGRDDLHCDGRLPGANASGAIISRGVPKVTPSKQKQTTSC